MHVLLVDDDENICKTLELSLKDLGCSVTRAASVPDALRALETGTFDLILTDFRMAGQTGLELTREARRRDPNALVVVMTAFASYENAVAMMKEGAFDYLPKPFTSAQLGHLLTKVRTLIALRRENEELKRSGTHKDYFAGLTSPASRRLEEFVRKVAPTEATLLLVGESGTGKSELAKLIHQLSPRANRAFVTVQCTSLTETLIESELFGHVKGAFTGATHDKTGKLEVADGGTLFLDEIGDLPPNGQSKLLRFLQERVFERVGGNKEISVDTRIVAATNKKLDEEVKTGHFREDLYYRLNILECALVPLRFRSEDVPILTRKFLKELRSRYGEEVPAALPPDIDAIFAKHPWPGNIRELKNALERLVMLSRGREMRRTDLPESMLSTPVSKPQDPIVPLEELERRAIKDALARERNLEEVAAKLGISTVTLWRKRREYGLD